MPESKGPAGQGHSTGGQDFDADAVEFRDQVDQMSRGGNMSRRDAAYELAKADNLKVTQANADIQAAEKRGPSVGQSIEQPLQEHQAPVRQSSAANATTSFGYERLDMQGQQEAAARHFKALQAAPRDEGRRATPEAETIQPENLRDEGRKASPEAVNGPVEITRDEGRRTSPVAEAENAQTKDELPREKSDREQAQDAYKELIREHQNQEHNLNTDRSSDHSRG